MKGSPYGKKGEGPTGFWGTGGFKDVRITFDSSLQVRTHL